jgi:hypothetical protein
MIPSVIFGIAAAAFVFFTAIVVYSLSKREPDNRLGWATFNIGVYLILVALSAGIM